MTHRNLKTSEKNGTIGTCQHFFFLYLSNVSDYNKIQKNQTTSERKANCKHEHLLAGLRRLKYEDKS